MSGFVSRVRRHLADPQSHHRRIAIRFLWVSLFVLIGKLAGAAKEMTIAWRYGISATVDAYVFVFNLVNWPVSVWFSVVTVVLVPLVASVRHDDPVELPRFRGELFGLTLILGFVLGLLVWFGLTWLLKAGWVRLSDKALAEALRMAGALALLAPLGVSISLFSAWMLACGRHRNTLLEALPALAILIALLVQPGWLPDPLLWGTVAGFALHLVALGAPLKRQGELQTPRFAFASPVWRTFWNSIGVMVVGQVLMSFTTIIDQFFAAGLGAGALATLNYANRILALILGMGGIAISRATLPIFSEVSSKSDADVTGMALSWAKWMSFWGLAVVAVGWMAAHSGVGLLFERGAFTASDSGRVATVLQYALIQIPFYAYALTLVNLMASQKKYRALLVSGVVGVLVKIPATAVLVSFMQLRGLVLSAALVYLSSAILFYLLARMDAR